MGFDFTATAQCNYCGNYLNSSDAECEHSGESVRPHIFRRLKSDKLTVIRATPQYKWQKLADTKGEDWIAWVYLGKRSIVSKYLERRSIEDIPQISMSVDARDVELDEK